ncbi:hypothetical protein MAJJADAN_00048 [Pseudomonas phage Amjad_SA]|nr:hypothetical protein MAJJADAN_00048 [Pseudomonas phage Amjad_SA]
MLPPASFPLALTNTSQIFSLAGGMVGAQQIVLTFTANPSAGTAKIEVLPVGSTSWVTLQKALALPLNAAPYFIRSAGWISAVRVTLAGVTGGAGGLLWVQQSEIPVGTFEGLAAITTQPYTEANVKNGLQFYIRAVWPKTETIPSGATRKIWFNTGSSPVIVKARVFEFDAEELRIDLYAGPTGVSGGTVITPQNYNRVAPVAAVSSALKNVTTVTDGTPFDPTDPEYFFGASNSPQRTPGSILQGRERILPANAQFIVAITNTGSSAARAQYFLDYYQGATDLPL